MIKKFLYFKNKTLMSKIILYCLYISNDFCWLSNDSRKLINFPDKYGKDNPTICYLLYYII